MNNDYNWISSYHTTGTIRCPSTGQWPEDTRTELLHGSVESWMHCVWDKPAYRSMQPRTRQPCAEKPIGIIVVVYHPVVSDSLMAPWTAACQPPPSMAFPRQEYWSGVPLPSPSPYPNSLGLPGDLVGHSPWGHKVLGIHTLTHPDSIRGIKRSRPW